LPIVKGKEIGLPISAQLVNRICDVLKCDGLERVF
jgi:hypothetical protein